MPQLRSAAPLHLQKSCTSRSGLHKHHVLLLWDNAKLVQFEGLLSDQWSATTMADGLVSLDQNDVNASVDGLTNVLHRAAVAMKCRPQRPRHTQVRTNSDWWDSECEQLRRTKSKSLNCYRRLNRPERLADYIKIRTDFNKLCKTKAADHRRSMLDRLRCGKNNLWNTIKVMYPASTPTPSNCVPPDSWFHYFQDLFSSNVQHPVESESLAEHDRECLLCSLDTQNENDSLNKTITVDEITAVVNDLPSDKSGGIDGIVYEMIRSGHECLINYLHPLFNKILSTGCYPDVWCQAVISPLHKKGSRHDERNYRAISLLCTISKVFTKILSNRLMNWAEANDKLDEGQGAYRKQRSTTEHIFTLNAIVQKYLSKKGGRYYCAFFFSAISDIRPQCRSDRKTSRSCLN